MSRTSQNIFYTLLRWVQRYISHILILVQIVFVPFLCAHADVEEIRKRGKLLVGVCMQEQKPFYYKDKEGKLAGIDMNVSALIAKALDVEVEYVQDRFTWAEVVTDVEQGRVDIATTYLSLTPARAARVAYSQPYAVVRTIFIMNRALLAKANSLGLNTMEQIVQDGQFHFYTSGGSSFTELSHKLFGDAKIYTDTSTTKKLLADEAVAYFTDEMDVDTIFTDHPEYKLHLVNYALKDYKDYVAIPVNYKNPQLLSVVNTVLATDGIFYTMDDVSKIMHMLKAQDE